MRATMCSVMSLGLILGGNPATAAAAPAQGPEYVGMFDALTSSGTMIPLERQTGTNKVKAKALGFGGAKSEYDFSGERSTVRFKSGDGTRYVVRVASQDTDPSDIVQFFPMTAKKGARIIAILSSGPLGFNYKDQYNHGGVPFIASKYGSSFFIVQPSQPLEAGEYALCTKDGKDCFLFGVD